MKRATAAFISILLVSSVIVAISVFQLPPFSPSEPLNFRWGVEVGEEFSFQIEVFGWDYNGSEAIPFIEYNNTQIIARIVQLPNVSLVDNETEFLDVIGILKVECRFSNGTEIAMDCRDGYYGNTNVSLPEVISRAIFPVGGWEFIDDLYDDIPYTSYPDGKLSKFDGDGFFYEDAWYYYDFGHGWRVHLDLSDGSPNRIELWEDDFICIGEYSVVLTRL
ncbi:MAG: hypothetical protein ACFFAX_03295 [Promethearchaeota archaeon]